MELNEAFVYAFAGAGSAYLFERKIGYSIAFFVIAIILGVNL